MIDTTEILNRKEREQLINLFLANGLTKISIEETGIIFKEDELPSFLNPNESPEIGLEKILALHKITSVIYKTVQFNCSIELVFRDYKYELLIEFHE